MPERFKYDRNNIAADLYRINDDSRACRNFQSKSCVAGPSVKEWYMEKFLPTSQTQNVHSFILNSGEKKVASFWFFEVLNRYLYFITM